MRQAGRLIGGGLYSIPVGIVQPVDKMQVAGTATAGTDRKLAGELGLRPGRESRGLFVADMHPAELVTGAGGVGHWVEAVADDPLPDSGTVSPGLYSVRSSVICPLPFWGPR
jgi:hypothetical protein